MNYLATVIGLAAMVFVAFTSGFTETVFSAAGTVPAGHPSGSPCANPGTMTLAADRDASVAKAFGSTNFGRDAALAVESRELRRLSAGNRRSLVGFDLRAIGPFCKVAEATLWLYSTSAASGRTVAVHQVGGPWAEDAVNWKNHPATIGPPATAESGTGWRSWDVRGQVIAMTWGSNNGFLVHDADEESITSQTQIFQSREGGPSAQTPKLVLELQ